MLMAIAERILEHPLAFQTSETLLGAQNCHRRFLGEHVQPLPDDRVLDLGCGIGNSLKFLAPTTRYVGVDIHGGYISYAKRRYGTRGIFKVADATSDLDFGTTFDKVFSFGVLHHLPDDAAGRLVTNAMRLLKPGGAFVSGDPCYAPGQPRIAKFLIDHDRGKHVRTEARYREIFAALRIEYLVIVSDMLRVPYTLLIAKVYK
jgi:SAM-dependent methyltransferase